PFDRISSSAFSDF
nr:RecName: Full=Lymna-DF-amide 5 [Lymnaea stagnalis]AAB26366.1 lymnaDFamide 5=neuropeptide homolog [Lymnaea stagnalis=snails, ganglia, Peptide, 13 aa] [Lymnaea stagnalis]